MDTVRKTIMLVDDNATNLTIGKNILIKNYDVFTLESGFKLFKVLRRLLPDLILLDIEMPEMNGYEVIKHLKASDQYCRIPVIFLTAKNDSGSELEGLSLGAVDYITKPFSPPLLIKRIEHQVLLEDQKRSLEIQKKELEVYNEHLEDLVEQKTRTVVELQNAVLQTMAEMVEWRDDVTGEHINRTQQFLGILVEGVLERGIYPEYAGIMRDKFFIQSAQLHDVGKIGIQDAILSKPDRLTTEEFELVKNHTSFGGMVINRISRNTTEQGFLNHARLFAMTHHEHWDGTGYPAGLKGTDIPIHGRLMAIADVYDALISQRPYKAALPHQEAVGIIVRGKGSHFDPVLTDVFIEVEPRFEAALTAA
jgi:putative two-component system response regulator